MKTLLRWFILLAILGGCACSSTQVGTGTQQLMEGCTAASAAIKVLTVANDKGKLSAAQQRATLQAIGLINPVCAGPEVPTLTNAGQSAFLAAVHDLEANAAEVNHGH